LVSQAACEEEEEEDDDKLHGECPDPLAFSKWLFRVTFMQKWDICLPYKIE
jgi:hypothetical protein